MTLTRESSPTAVRSTGTQVVDRVSGWAAARPDAAAYTFVDYLADARGEVRTCTWSQLYTRALALAERLGAVASPGDRVAVLAPSGTGYVVALLASWYAGLIAVPLFPPDLPGHADRLTTTYDDCAPRCVLTVPQAADAVRSFVADRRRPAEVVVLTERDDPAPARAATPVDPGAVAYLQYSSGSTGRPRGVEICHANLTANVAQLVERLTGDRSEFTAVNWLPLFHDMGLLASVAVPMWHGTDAVLFDPVAFLMHPRRWLEQLSGRASAYTCAPDFAYDYCLRRLGPADLADLDLRGVFLWLNGAEPVRASTVRRFTRRLREAGTGIDERAVCAAYGLAEATVFVSGDLIDRRPPVTHFSTLLLQAGRAEPVAGPDPTAEPDPTPAPDPTVAPDRTAGPGPAGEPTAAADPPAGSVPPPGPEPVAGLPAAEVARSTALVSCGPPAGQQVVAVDPVHLRLLPEGQVGELWVHGPNVAHRYWGAPQESSDTFAAVLAGPVPDGLPRGPWLRTGDLGLLHRGELYVTGRLKDLIIVAGRNHYPQDLEDTATQTDPVLGRSAAFSPGDRGDVVVVAEVSGTTPAGWQPGPVAAAVRRAVWQRHGLALHDVVLTVRGALPRTTSGKVSRTACRDAYLGDRIPRLDGAGAVPGARP